VGPLIGGPLGGIIYDLFVGRRHPPECQESEAL